MRLGLVETESGVRDDESNPMRIAFDLRPGFLPNSRRRGIGRYSRDLAAALVRHTRHQFLFYSVDHGCIEEPGNFHCKSLWHLRRPSRLNWLVDRYRLPRQLEKDRPRLFQATEITAVPDSAPCRVWATVHDLIPFLFWKELKQTVPWDYAKALSYARRCVEKADRIITVSLSSRNDVVENWRIDPARVDVVYPGVSLSSSTLDPDQAREELARRRGISDRFVFYLGGTDFRKNLPRLLTAFARLRSRGYPGRLVLAGETFLQSLPEVQRLRARIEELQVGEFVSTPGHLPDSELGLFFRASDCFVFPSLYEGFGLPVLEALHCGAAVACSRSSSLPEVAGEAAVYFDPEDESSLTDCIASVLEDGRKAHELRKSGPVQARKFSWEKAAQRFDALYRTHLSG